MSDVRSGRRPRRTRRFRLALYGTGLCAFGLYVAVRAEQLRTKVETLMVGTIAQSLEYTIGEFTSVLRNRQAQATLLAHVLAQRDRGPTRAREHTFHENVLRSLTGRDGYVASWIGDARSGAAMAAAGDTLPAPAPGLARGIASARSGTRIFLDVADTSGNLRVVLRTAPDEHTITSLNPERLPRQSGRTTILARIGDSLYVVATRTNGSRTLPARVFPTRGVPQTLERAARGQPYGGVAEGIAGTRVAFAVAPMGVPGWMLLREEDVDEVLHDLRGGFLVEVALVGLIDALLLVLIDNVARVTRLRHQQELTQVRADFVSSVSHELRTPLAQIRMYAELLRKGTMNTPEDRSRALGVIEKEAHRLNILVDNVLNFTRLRREASSRVTSLTRVDDDVAHVCVAFAPLANERRVTVRTCVESGLTADVDSLALRQIVLNLLENAVKYGPTGQTVTVGAAGQGGVARIWVDDHGPGIPEDERDRVWEPFVRGASTFTKTSGSGIGLSVVRDLVLQYGGSCAIERNDAGGARIVVDLPRHAGASDPSTAGR